jgi:hypothetical protein
MSVGLRNVDLEFLCKRIIGRRRFLGVFPCDASPPSVDIPPNFAIIFNLAHHDEFGSHFIAVARTNRKVTYFDSFGEPCRNAHILSFLHTLSDNAVVYNKRPIQHKTSIYCGLFCLYFLCICFLQRKPLQTFQSTFNPHRLKLNDKLVVRAILTFVNKRKHK